MQQLQQEQSMAVNDRGWKGKVTLLVISLLFLLFVALGFYWSQEPELWPWVDQSELLDGKMTGVATATALIDTSSVLLNKPGGYLANDMLSPSIFLDNIHNWELGVLIQVRDLARALRKDMARSQSQSTEDIQLVKAENQFFFNSDSWAFPETEAEYQRGIDMVSGYRQRLQSADSRDAQFYARADNLNNWLGDVSTRLGSLSQRLSASVGRAQLDIDLASQDVAQGREAPADVDVQVKTAWLEIDNVFYESRGSTWALLHFFRAAQIDFSAVLEQKNAQVSMEQVIRELKETQRPVHSPMILNGSGFGVLANHSLVMANYISRANAAIMDLRRLLSEG